MPKSPNRWHLLGRSDLLEQFKHPYTDLIAHYLATQQHNFKLNTNVSAFSFPDVVCSVDNTRFNKDMLDTDILLHEHIYNTKTPTFYFCFVHSHHHISHPTLPCVIQTYKCCDAAVFVKDFTKCFLVKTESMTAMKKAAGKKPTAAMPAQPTFDEYIIFDPAIWREQSYNHFMSFVRAIIALPEAVAERYLRFENSNFTISNVKKYISTKESVIRSAVTGFETYGIYQTAIISCSIPYYAVVIPQKLYDLLEVDHFDLDLVMVLRHPSIKTTCMYICKAMRNSDPNVDVIVISDQQSVGLNQDQDGDQNGVFLFKKQINGYDATKSYFYKVAKMELAAAFRKKQTLIGQPRYYLSETSLLKIKRNAADFMHLDFFRKTYKDGIKFMNEAAAGYLSKEYDEFQEALCLHNKTERPSYLGVDDFCLDTDRIPSIVSSGAQTNADLIPMALNNVSSDKTLKLLEKDMLALCNNYISSSKDLSRNGRKAFAALYASHDMVAFLGNLYINKVVYANYNKFASAFAFLFNEASLELCIRELEELPDAQ